jgi:hypothetical protein
MTATTEMSQANATACPPEWVRQIDKPYPSAWMSIDITSLCARGIVRPAAEGSAAR